MANDVKENKAYKKPRFSYVKHFQSVIYWKTEQLDCIHQFVSGRDLFVNKPTGSGKSIIFQVAPFVKMALANVGDSERKTQSYIDS